MRRTSSGLEIAACPAEADVDQRSRTTTLRPAGGLFLIHATAGTELAGSILRWRAREGWLVTRQLRSGSRVGQWYRTLSEAQARFDSLSNPH